MRFLSGFQVFLEFPRTFQKFPCCAMLWNVMEYCGTSWNVLESPRTWQKVIEGCRTLQNLVEAARMLQNILEESWKVMESNGRTWKVMEHQRRLWKVLASQVTRVIVEYSRIVVEYINPMYLQLEPPASISQDFHCPLVVSSQSLSLIHSSPFPLQSEVGGLVLIWIVLP